MITLVLGGTRSGKSAVAERVAASSGPTVTYVATAWVDAGDLDHVARVDAHRRRRPASWTTIECRTAADLVAALGRLEGPVLVDSLGTWVTADPAMAPDVDALVDALQARADDTVVVSEEVGSAPHAPTSAGRRFVDQLGQVNTAVSAVADRALLVVAGRAIELPPPGQIPT